MRVSAEVRIDRNQTVAELKDVLGDVPDHATFRVNAVYYPDRPGEVGYESIIFSWDTKI